MPVIVIANPKGGSGKSTLSTNVAGFFASRGHAVMLGDADVQQSSKLWLDLRPPAATPISTWELQADLVLTAKPPRGTTHVVIDTPGGLGGWRFKEVVSRADKLLIPIMPSIFDMYAAQAFITQVREITKTTKTKLGIIGMRVDERTIAASKLREFMAKLDVPIVGYLRDTQYYLHLAAHGLSLFDITPAKVEKDLQQWQVICHWLES
ncbi:MAG: ParA family protein [Betaproteobacteria bacterium]|jgi:chromosome partitioning protein|nr:ParA family protein [Betaproteobacteria bacterium]